MPAFPTFTNGVVSQMPYTEEDCFINVEDWVESGFATTFALDPSAPQKVFGVNLPCITAPELVTFENFFKQMGQVGTFAFPADDKTVYTKCRFDSSKYTVTYVGPNEYSVSVPIRSLGNASQAIPPGQVVTAATVSVLTSHIPGAQYDAFGTILDGLQYGFYPGALYNNGTPLFDKTAWTLRTDTWTLDPTRVDFYNLSAYVLSFLITGTLGGTTSPADQFLIYDASMAITRADGTTATLRPQTAQALASSQGDVQNPTNANDGNPSTYALIERSSFSSLGNSPELQLTNFQ